MRVFAARLGSTDVSVTLIETADGWQFSHWEKLNERILVPPPDSDRARCFATATEALEYFQLRYVEMAPQAPRPAALRDDPAA